MPPPTGYRRSKATDSRSRTTEPRRPRLRSAVAVCLVLLGLSACGGDNLVLPRAGEPSLIEVVSGNDQVDTVGRALPAPLVVEVTDPEGRAVEGVEVVFLAPAGALAPNDTVYTGPDGRAAVQYTLPTVSGQQTIEVRAKPVVPSPSLTTTFSAVAQPEPAVTLLAASGTKHEAEVLTALPESLAVSAVDRFGNGVAGVEVTWSASGGVVSPEVVVTGADGRAATQRTLGARPGVYRTSAEVPNLEGSPILFEATGTAPPSPQLVLVTEPSSSVQAGQAFEQQPVLQLQTAVGAPLAQAGVAVTVQIAEGDGSLGGKTTVRSDAEGRVAYSDLSIRGGPGERTLLFAAADFTPATSQKIEVRVGPPSRTRSSASVGTGTAGEQTTVSIHLEDEFGSEVEGAVGTLRVRVEGANSTEASVREVGNGDYSASYIPTVAGDDRITIELNGSAIDGSPLVSTVAPGPAAASRTNAQVRREGSFFYEIIILVTVRDAHGNSVGRGGDRVQVQLEGAGGSRDARDNGDGTYSDQFIILMANPSIVITLNGEQISGSPYRP